MGKAFSAILGGTAVVAVICLTPPAAAVTLGFAVIVTRGISRLAVAAQP
ncbi:MAG TPA: hypothetical protein VF731_07895 [Solirubrobacterales bacterium]